MTYTNRYRTTGASRARFSLRSSGRSIRSAELDARKAERDDEGTQPGAWTLGTSPRTGLGCGFCSVDPLDEREDIRVCGLPNQCLRDELAKAEMEAGESSAD